MSLELVAVLAAVLVPVALWGLDQLPGPSTAARAARLRIASTGALGVCCSALLLGAGPLCFLLGAEFGVWLYIGLDRGESRTARQFWSGVWRMLWNAWRWGG